MSKDEKGALISTGSGAIAGGTSAIAGVFVGAAEGTAGAAALTSGLASVGSVVGGGMAAGIGIVCVAPILMGAAGYGIFKFFKWASS